MQLNAECLHSLKLLIDQHPQLLETLLGGNPYLGGELRPDPLHLRYVILQCLYPEDEGYV